MGPAGPVGLNDVSINHAMDTYFEVDKKEKLQLSQNVRRFCGMILKEKSKKMEQESKRKK